MKKQYNNLFDSIILTILLGAAFFLNSLIIPFCTQPHPFIAILLVVVVMSSPTIGFLGLIILGCYEYWYIKDNLLISKKPFRKAKTINLDITPKLHKKTVNALVLGLYKSEAYIVEGIDGTKITILVNDKNSSFVYNNLIAMFQKNKE